MPWYRCWGGGAAATACFSSSVLQCVNQVVCVCGGGGGHALSADNTHVTTFCKGSFNSRHKHDTATMHLSAARGRLGACPASKLHIML